MRTGLLTILGGCAPGNSVEVPDDYVSTLQSDDKLDVETDGEVKTQ